LAEVTRLRSQEQDLHDKLLKRIEYHNVLFAKIANDELSTDELNAVRSGVRAPEKPHD
jgi:hypothetical protein